MNARKKLRQMLAGPKPILAPGAHNGVSARIIEKVGCDAVYATGYGASANVLGWADVGLMSMTEMVTHMRYLVGATSLPVIADCDTGYGNALNVTRSVREYEQAGVAALQLEDQVMPKKCGHMLGRELISKKEMVGKIEAAVAARRDDDMVIIARTDARTKYGIEEAIQRGQDYAKAGADIIFIESPESVEEMKRLNDIIPVPTLANMVEKGRTPLLSVKELGDLGYKLIIFPVTSVLAEAKLLFNVYSRMLATGSTNDMTTDILMDFEEFNILVGADEVRRIEAAFLPKELGD